MPNKFIHKYNFLKINLHYSDKMSIFAPILIFNNRIILHQAAMKKSVM